MISQTKREIKREVYCVVLSSTVDHKERKNITNNAIHTHLTAINNLNCKLGKQEKKAKISQNKEQLLVNIFASNNNLAHEKPK